MVCDAIQTQVGLSFEQFQLFITSAIACIKLLYAECEQAGYLCVPEPVVTGDVSVPVLSTSPTGLGSAPALVSGYDPLRA